MKQKGKVGCGWNGKEEDGERREKEGVMEMEEERLKNERKEVDGGRNRLEKGSERGN